MGLMLLLLSLFVPDEFEGGWLLVATYVLGIVAFITYDIALSKLITLYFVRIREQIKIYRFLK